MVGLPFPRQTWRLVRRGVLERGGSRRIKMVEAPLSGVRRRLSEKFSLGNARRKGN